MALASISRIAILLCFLQVVLFANAAPITNAQRLARGLPVSVELLEHLDESYASLLLSIARSTEGIRRPAGKWCFKDCSRREEACR